jgi:hypothetical protein
MAHFAQIDNNNIVINIIVVHNNELLDQDGNEIEQKGIDFCKSLFGQDTKWVQTSYNGNFRKNYACGGGVYDETRDAFIAPKPYNSWILNETTCLWEAPVPMPQDGNLYEWNEETLSWDLTNNQIGA